MFIFSAFFILYTEGTVFYSHFSDYEALKSWIYLKNQIFLCCSKNKAESHIYKVKYF
jgi:hypothetical protein